MNRIQLLLIALASLLVHSGPLYVIQQAYCPKQEILSGTYKIPPVQLMK